VFVSVVACGCGVRDGCEDVLHVSGDGDQDGDVAGHRLVRQDLNAQSQLYGCDADVAHCDADADGNRYADADGNRYADADADGNRYAHGDGVSYRDSDSYGDAGGGLCGDGEWDVGVEFGGGERGE
jgi:hypothetical protein